MSHDFESRFQKEVNQRKSDKQQQRIIVAALFFLVMGSIYCAYHSLLFPLVLLIGIQIGLLVRLRSFQRLLSQAFDRIPILQRLKSSRLGQLDQRSWIGVAILLSVLGLQAYPNLIITPFKGMVTQLRHNPQPHITASPWPWKPEDTLHPAIVNMPPEAEKSINSVAAYIMQAESDPWLRTKAVHDYVIHHLTYDIDVLKTAGSKRPEQNAESVFKSQKAVCEGYAKLFKALGNAMGMEVAYVRGNVRRDFAPTDVIPPFLRFSKSTYDWTYHAWNTVKIDNQWFLVDATWDDSKDEQAYRSEYLLLPPEVMIVSHRPEQKSWQLLEDPTSSREFEQQPILSPSFFSDDLELRVPQTYQTKVKGVGKIQIKAPKNYDSQFVAGFIKEPEQKFSFLDLSPSQQDEQDMQFCQTGSITAENIQLSCEFPEPGNYQVVMFKGNARVQESIGQLKFTSS